MRSVVQRVARAAVRVDRQVVGEVGHGLLVLLGVAAGDSPEECRWMADKLAQLRIFEDEAGKMNRSVLDAGGSILLVSQFTLLGDARKGNRPSFVGAAPPEQANALYEEVAALLRARSVPVATGVFRAHMEVELVNDGPVTLILDSQR
jgi:D-tyrosyl-tRNA(Tyr) deacylase